MKSVQHQYAEVAYESICEIKTREEAFAKQYGQLCHRFPSLVLTNGLRLAYAFFNAKDEGTPYRLYLEHIGKAVGQDFTEPLIYHNQDYLILSQKVLRASVWFKRYAEAVLKVEQGMEIEGGPSNDVMAEDMR